MEYDRAELSKQCSEADLPQPPNLGEYEPGLAAVMLEKITTAIRDGSAENVGRLGNLYAAIAESRDESNRAIACFQKAKELAPESYEWPYYLSQVFLKRASYVRTRAELIRTCELNPDYAMAHGWLGNLALRDKKIADAGEQFKKFTELRPEDAFGYNGLALVALESGDLDEARRLVDVAFKLDPSNGWTYALSARQYAESGEPLLASQHNAIAKSLPTQSGILKRDPLALQELLAMGPTKAVVASLNMFAESGDVLSAGVLSDALMSAHPNNFELQAGVAQVELFKGDAKKAIALAEAAKKLNSTSVTNTLTLARAYLADGRFDDALAEADRAVELDPKSARAHRIKGKILFDMGRFEESKEEFMIDFGMEPENPRSANYIADIWRQLGDIPKSNQFYEKTLLALDLGEFPSSMRAPIYAGMAENQLVEGEIDKAIAEYKRAITADSKNTVIFTNFIELLLRENRKDEALSYCVRAVDLSPEVLGYQFIHAEVLERIGQHKEALRQIEKVRRANQSNPPVYLLRGKILSDLGRQDEALASFETALELDPKFEAAHVGIMELFLAQGDLPRLVEAVQRGLEEVPTSVRLANAGAWVLATNRDASLRNPKEAIRLGEIACKESKRSAPSCLDTLACAYAADGRFDDAKSTMAEAIALAKNNPALAEEVTKYESRLTVFNEGKAYIDMEH